MKILRIAGRNLASLGEFELNLAEPPLLHAGVFCITGATGSGKSTLLDAMCLALYGRIPRLIERSSQVKIERSDAGSMSLSDVRQIVRHGAIDAHAEVDFLANGRRFRSTWRVERAHRRAHGALKDPLIQLLDLDAAQIISEGNKSAALKLITQTIGLDFDQFCRSVLLAQGDFAAFLRARKDERAALLEAITGTELYARVSVEVYRRSAEAAQALTRVQDALALNVVWSTDHREQAHARLQEIDLERTLLSALLLVQQADNAAFERFQRATDALNRSRATLCKLLPASSVSAGPELLAQGQTIHAQFASNLTHALKIDAQTQALQTTIDSLTLEISAAQSKRQEQTQAAQASAHEQLSIELEVNNVQQWLTANQDVQAWAAQWPRWEHALQQAHALQRKRDAQTAQCQRLKHQISGIEAHCARQQALLLHAENTQKLALEAHEAALRRLHLHHATAAPASDQQRLALSEDLQRLARMRVVHSSALEASVQLDRAKLKHSDLELLARENAQACASSLLTRDQIALECTERSQELSHVSATAELSLRRPDLLIDGAPCPLCGALEHPAAQHPGPLDSVLATLRAENELARKRLAALENKLTELHTASAVLAERQSSNSTQLSAITQRLNTLGADWRALRAVADPDDLSCPATPAWLSAQTALQQAQWDAWVLQDAQARELQASCNALALKLNEADKAFRALETDRRLSNDELISSRAAQSTEERVLAAEAQQLTAQLRVLDEPLAERSSWQQQFASEPLKLIAELAEYAVTWHRQTQRSEQLRLVLGVAREANAIARGGETTLSAHCAQLLLQQQAIQRRQAEHQSDLRALLGDRALSTAQAEHLARGDALVLLSKAEVDAQQAGSTLPTIDASQLLEQMAASRVALDGLSEERGALAASISHDQALEGTRTRLQAEHAQALSVADQWERLNSVVGSADGRKFRVFAQTMTLEILLEASNGYLATLRPRYALTRLKAHDMEIAVIDRELGSEMRPIQSLSGGETFLVSLALALGLSSLSANHVQIDSLFIDEGFAALDPLALDSALELLDRLQAQGRQIGIISHLTELADRVAARVKVEPHAMGLSTVKIEL